MQAHLAQSSFGRILLHMACASRDHKYQWHWQGIRRELHRANRPTRRIDTPTDLAHPRILF
jgi:hypothetical protein